MEIVKQNCTFNITDVSKEGWVLNGLATKETNGALNISLGVSATGELSEYIGDLNYSKQVDSDRSSVSYTILEKNRDEFLTYIYAMLDSILTELTKPA